MTTARVTITLPAELRQAAQDAADNAGVPFSTVVSEALAAWVRGRLVDTWLAEHQAEHGAFDEDELRMLASEAGVPYVPAGRSRRIA
jgi:post-segregation antitoxin (ccd killing protein)